MAINIKFPLRPGAQGAFETNDTTIEAVKDDIRILLITNHGERPVQYDFGCNLRALLFENMTDDLSVRIEDAITAAIDKWMPFVTILSVDVLTSITDSTLRENEVLINLNFAVGQQQDLLQQRIRV